MNFSVFPKNTTQYPRSGLRPRPVDPGTSALIMGPSHHEATRSVEGGKKCAKINSARAQPLFYSLNLLSGIVLVAVVAVVCLSSLIFILCYTHVDEKIACHTDHI